MLVYNSKSTVTIAKTEYVKKICYDWKLTYHELFFYINWVLLSTCIKSFILTRINYKKWKGLILSDNETRMIFKKLNKVKTGGFSLQIASNFGELHWHTKSQNKELTMQIQIIPFKLVYNLKLINQNFGLIEVLSFLDQILSLKWQVLHLKLNSMNLNCLRWSYISHTSCPTKCLVRQSFRVQHASY